MKNKTKIIPLCLGVIILSLFLAYLLNAAWTEPTVPPPQPVPGVYTPINIGPVAQTKAGPLQVSGFRNIGTTILDGNVGIGTVNPGEKLDVIGSAGFTSIRRIGPGSNNPERGPWNPLWTSIAAGRAVYADEEFALGKNGVGVYNNAGGDGVQHFWETGDGSQPNQSGKWIRIVNNGNPTSPGFGGFVQTIHSRRNATFVQRFRAKLPVGYFLNIAENPQGTNRTSYWLTSNAGTGKWEEYIRISHSGNTGIFSTGGHVFVTGPGKSNIFTWYLASSNVYEVGSPPGIFSGNVGIGDTTPDSRLDVEGGDIRISTGGRGLIFPDGTKQTTAPVGVNLHGWSFADNFLRDDGENVIQASDEWLRLNQQGHFTSGVHTPGTFFASGVVRADGGFQIDGGQVIEGNRNRFWGAHGQEMFRTWDDWLRLNQAGHFAHGVYTPGLLRADGGFQVDGHWVIDSTGWIVGDRIQQNTIDSSEIQNHSIQSWDLAPGVIPTPSLTCVTRSHTATTRGWFTLSCLAGYSVTGCLDVGLPWNWHTQARFFGNGCRTNFSGAGQILQIRCCRL